MITLTDNAASKVAQLLEAEGASEMALRVAVKSGGCSGFSYDMYFDGDIATDDITLTFGAVRVVV
ncbi:MAG: HesB/IscA family protein, partial [Ilumatobacteraceae bacterium]